MSIVLIGYRGSGKTTIGRKLAERLQRPFVDTDDLIVEKAGRSIAEIFRQHGEVSFRDLESEVIREVSRRPEHVVALGGGALGREENRRMLIDPALGHKVIYLRCEPAVLLERIQADPKTASNRPSLTSLGGGIEEINRVLAQREPIYRQATHIELDVTRLTADEAVTRIVSFL